MTGGEILSNKNNPFTDTSYDLGGYGGVAKGDVDTSFRSGYTVDTPCIYCGNTAQLRIIPKDERLLTAMIQDRGFICTACATKGCLDSVRYGVRKL